jgi:hypothetical protein
MLSLKLAGYCTGSVLACRSRAQVESECAHRHDSEWREVQTDLSRRLASAAPSD